MRTNFNTELVKNYIDFIFNGNLREYKARNGSISYKNDNSEKIHVSDENGDTGETTDLAEFLDIHFYDWKERLERKESGIFRTWNGNFDEWVEGLDYSMNRSYALVERVDEEATPSQDIDNATIIGKITFLVQENKIDNLDYYVSKLRNKYLGVPQGIQNSYGDIIKAYVTLGGLNYDQEPFATPLGRVVVVSSNFRISYLTDALTWDDTKVEISLDNGLNYLEMPITKDTRQVIFSSQALPTQKRPDLVGFIASSLSTVETYSFYDINKELTNQLNDLFYSLGAVRINDQETTVRDVNIPVYIRLTTKINGTPKVYVYKNMIDNIQKVRQNSEFNISSITLKGWAKLSTQGEN